VVLALSDESPAVVDKFLEAEAYTVRTAASSRSKSDYGVTGIPKSFLVGPDGTLLWKGHPRELSRDQVRGFLKGARKPAEGDFLAVRPAPGARMHASLNSAVEAAEGGQLGLALEAAHAVAVSAEESAAARAAASTLTRSIEEHVALLGSQAEAYAADLDALPTGALLRGLASSLAGTAAGEAATRRLASLSEDEAWTRELAAAQALVAATQASRGRGKAETKRALQVVADEYSGTLAAKRARRRTKQK